MMDKVVRGIRVRVAAEAPLEPMLHVDHHADNEARGAPSREIQAPVLRRADMRRPSTSSVEGTLPSLAGSTVAEGGTAVGAPPAAIRGPSSKLFLSQEEMQERAATAQSGARGKMRSKARGVMAVGRMVPKQALRSVDDWVNTATKNKQAPPPKLDKRPLPPITPELEPPVTP